MGFFNILETFFFISLAITFILIMMLVYHFKGRITILEHKCDTMFEIMNNMVKEMKNMKHENQHVSSHLFMNPYGLQQSNIHYQQFENGTGNVSDTGNGSEEYETNSDTSSQYDENNEPRKIIVSDNEEEYELETEGVKVVHIELNDLHLEEEIIINKLVKDEHEDEGEETVENDLEEENEDYVDYKKMDVSYLRTLVISRGLASDTKKLKKTELINLLQQYDK